MMACDALVGGFRDTLRGKPNHTAGTWGPAEADELLARHGREWRPIEQ